MKTKLTRLLAVFLTLALMSVCAAVTVQADGVLTLPSDLQIIDVEAFCGDTSLGKVVVPEGTTEIRSKAFANSSLTEITLPTTLTSIADDAFAGCGQLSVVAKEGTYAYEWAVKKGYIEALPTTPAEFFTTQALADGTLEITGYTGNDTDVVIPAKIGGVPVTGIGMSAFYNRNSLTSIHIPDGVTSIGMSAFYDCGSLTSINIPDSVTSIGQKAFRGCGSLTNLHLPDSVTSIGESVFEFCSSLTSINIPDSVTSIGDSAFYSCSSLTSITLPDGVTSIGDHAFQICSNLTSINIPDGVTSIGDSAFSVCRSLTSIQLPNSVARIGNSTFASCSSLTSIQLPNSVTSIGSCAFSACRSLTSIHIPDGVTSIGDSAFWCCSNLTGINIPDGVTNIGVEMFYGCERLTSIHIPDGVTSIGTWAFASCRGLTSINIPYGVTSIGDYVFSDCSSLTSIIIPDSVTSIDKYAFRNCGSLTRIIIPNSVTRIADSAFQNCNDSMIFFCDEGSVADQYAKKYKNNIKYASDSQDPGNVLSEEYYEIVATYRIGNSIYYKANLLKDYNGVIAGTDTFYKPVFLDGERRVVRSPDILCQLYTVDMYCNTENTIRTSLNDRKSACQIWSGTALEILDNELMAQTIGGVGGSLIGTLLSGGTNALHEIAKCVSDNVIDSDQMTLVSQSAIIKLLLDRTNNCIDHTLSLPATDKDGAYNYDKVVAILEMYSAAAAHHEAVKGLCVPFFDEILSKYNSPLKLLTKYADTAVKAMLGNINPLLKLSITTLDSAIKGDGDGLALAKDILACLTDDNVLTWTSETLHYSLQCLEWLVGVPIFYTDEILDPYYLTAEEMRKTNLYYDHQLLAE